MNVVKLKPQKMLEKFLKQTSFSSMEDFRKNFELIIPDHFNFAYDVMDEWARTDPDKLAMLWTNDKGDCRRFTFGDMKRESDKAAAFFHSLGIGKGDMVMLILKRRWQFWPIIIGLHKIGAIAIPATFLLTSNDIVYRCTNAEVKAIVCCGDRDILRNVMAAEPNCPYLDLMISIGPDIPEGWIDYGDGIRQAEERLLPTQEHDPKAPIWDRGDFTNESEDPSLMYFTSGTSDEPKMVMHSYTYALGHLVTAAFWHKLTPESLHLTYSDTGWGKAVWGKLYGQWIVGAAVFVYDHDKFVPAQLLQKMSDYHITSFCAPPTIYRFLVREDISRYDLSSLKYCCTAGEALNPSVFEKWHDLTGLWIMEAFGQTETTLTVGTFQWMEARPGSMGVPNPSYDIDILKDDGTSAGPGEKGQIVIHTDKKKPAGLFIGYYRNPKTTRKAWHDGIYYTGDVASRDEDGYLWFEGRADDLIKTSGYRVSPFEVESALMKHPGIVECAVTGIEDPEGLRGTIIKASVVLAPEFKAKITAHGKNAEKAEEAKQSLIKAIQGYVKKVTAPYKYPRIIEFVDELPKTISGKIRHAEIRKEDAEKAKK